MIKIQLPQYDRSRKVARVARYATLLLLFLLFAGTHLPGRALPYQVVAGVDKFAHCFAYLALTFSVLVSLDLSIGQLRPQHYFSVWLLGTFYGAFDEVTQLAVGRHCDILDWFADIVGIVLGLTLFRIVRPLIYRWVKFKPATN